MRAAGAGSLPAPVFCFSDLEDAAFSDEFCRFLRAAVPTVDAAELLLLLQRSPQRDWTAAEAAAALSPAASVDEAEAARYFGVLQASALIVVGPEQRARYQPASDALDEHVRTLAQAYAERPVTLIRVIYALRDSKIQSFADAFRLKRS